MWPIQVNGLIKNSPVKVDGLCILLLLLYFEYGFQCLILSLCLLSSSLAPACIGEPTGSTLLLRQNEAVQTTRPGVPEG